MPPWVVVLLLVLVSLVLAIRWATRDRSEKTDHVVIESWLTCHDCLGGELDSVIERARLREAAVVDTLTRALTLGPGARLADLERTLRRMRYADSAYLSERGLSPATVPADSFVARSLARYEKAWRRRAAIALAGIYRQLHSSRALAALQGVPDTARMLALDSVLADTLHAVAGVPVPYQFVAPGGDRVGRRPQGQ